MIGRCLVYTVLNGEKHIVSSDDICCGGAFGTCAAACGGVAAREGQLLLADPFILEDDGWYYIYGTHADDGIVVYRSRDMRHWSERCGNARNALALHKDDVGRSLLLGTRGIQARGEGRYLMTYSAEEHICYAESDSPCGHLCSARNAPTSTRRVSTRRSSSTTTARPYMFGCVSRPAM